MTDHFTPPDLRLTAGVEFRGATDRPCLRIEQGDQTATITWDTDQTMPLLRVFSDAMVDASYAAAGMEAREARP